MEERHLLRGLRRGSEAALEQAMDTYGAYVYTIVSNLIGTAMGQGDVEEVVADVFFTLWNKADQIRSGKLKAWLGAVARNQARQKLRENRLELPLEDDVLTLPDLSPEETLEAREQERLVRQAVLAMQEPDREIFLRHYYYGQKVDDIARALDLKAVTVRSRLHRGRARLKEQFVKGEEPYETAHFRAGQSAPTR